MRQERRHEHEVAGRQFDELLLVLTKIDAGVAGQQIGAGFRLAIVVWQRSEVGALLALPNHSLVADVCCGPSTMQPDWLVLLLCQPSG